MKIYLMHQTHTDIGYTDRQEKITLYHVDYLQQAIRMSEAIDAGKTIWNGFVWNNEMFWIIERFIETTTPEWHDRLLAAVKRGHIQLTANYLNMTDLVDAHILRKFLQKALETLFGLFMHGARENRLNWFKTMNRYAHSGGHVFIGDSLIEEYQITECFPDHPVYNRGIGGDTTAGLAARLSLSVSALNPAQVFMLIGTNDLQMTDLEDALIAAAIVDLVETIRSLHPHIRVHVIKLLPVSRADAPHIDLNTVGRRSPERIKRVNDTLQTRLENRQNVILHDFTAILSDASGHLKAEYTREGLHLTPLAYEQLTEKIRPFLMHE